MKWEEFCALLSGLGEDSPLVRIVQIRLEDDPKVIEHFSSAQRRIRDEWRRKHSHVNTDEEAHKQFLAQVQAFFAQGGGLCQTQEALY